ncbi:MULTISPECIES: hypothetical protein [Eggerthellaceae]|uniref:Uncharacterized protein n=1 Tax=Xiamenia xianingshaonis TaxID=2682776 RepID=A0ABX0IMS7_9ACTN|nr:MULTISPECIES: hypothetical protein [Eggerthellaceae]NHM14775.1 hypothetical protein [Xiamenia xianingshaonis]NHM16783.1 hypothetical protein [Xiamenia xianingshaonis]
MGTYALGCFLQDQQTKTQVSEAAAAVIRDLRNAGKLRALPIVSTDKETGVLTAVDGSELCEYGQVGSGRWIRRGDGGVGDAADGSVLYLGSATHAGHIELKALCVSVGGVWYNIISGLPQQ